MPFTSYISAIVVAIVMVYVTTRLVRRTLSVLRHPPLAELLMRNQRLQMLPTLIYLTSTYVMVALVFSVLSSAGASAISPTRSISNLSLRVGMLAGLVVVSAARFDVAIKSTWILGLIQMLLTLAPAVAAAALVGNAQLLGSLSDRLLESSREFMSALIGSSLAAAFLVEGLLLFASPPDPDASGDTAADDGTQTSRQWDVFICHASEDKNDVVEPLVLELQHRGKRVWYDRWVLNVGDSLRRKIDRGLASSRFGVVILSPDFFRKQWPQHELDGLVQLELGGKSVILPVWHNVNHSDVERFSPTLADKVATSSAKGMEEVARDLIRAMD